MQLQQMIGAAPASRVRRGPFASSVRGSLWSLHWPAPPMASPCGSKHEGAVEARQASGSWKRTPRACHFSSMGVGGRSSAPSLTRPRRFAAQGIAAVVGFVLMLRRTHGFCHLAVEFPEHRTVSARHHGRPRDPRHRAADDGERPTAPGRRRQDEDRVAHCRHRRGGRTITDSSGGRRPSISGTSHAPNTWHGYPHI